MKKILVATVIAMAMAGTAHAQPPCPGQFADSAGVCWQTQAQADAATASYTQANELPAQQAQQPTGGNSFVPLAPIPGLTQGVTANSAGLATFFNNLYKYLIGLAAVLAIIQIIWAGLDIAFFHKDAVSAITNDKGKIYNAIFGLVLVLSPALVFSIINPSILNLSLNLPALTSTSGPSGGFGLTGGKSQAPTVTDQNGCIIHTGQYLETALCPNQAAVSSYSCTNRLDPTTGTCVADPSGKCVSGANVYCGKTVNVYYYRATHGGYGITVAGLSGAVIPRDAPIQSAFATGCATDGGTMNASTVFVAKLRITTSVLMPGSGCPSDSGITFDTGNQAGVLCYTEQLACVPK